MKIVVTGANGLVGRAVTSELAQAGHEVTGVDRRADPYWSGVVVADLLNRDALDVLAAGADAIVHLAAIPRPWLQADEIVFANNTRSTFNVLEAAAHAGVERVVVASSISVLGLVWSEREQAPLEIPVTEGAILQVADPYALSKQVDEATAKAAAARYGLSVIALRFPDMGDEEHVRKRHEAAAQDSNHGARELWAFLPLREAARAVRLAVDAELTGYHVLNVSSPTSLGGVDVESEVRRRFPACRINRPIAAGESAYDSSLAKRLIGFEARSNEGPQASPTREHHASTPRKETS